MGIGWGKYKNNEQIYCILILLGYTLDERFLFVMINSEININYIMKICVKLDHFFFFCLDKLFISRWYVNKVGMRKKMRGLKLVILFCCVLNFLFDSLPLVIVRFFTRHSALFFFPLLHDCTIPIVKVMRLTMEPARERRRKKRNVATNNTIVGMMWKKELSSFVSITFKRISD
jgi:hypothetical protein